MELADTRLESLGPDYYRCEFTAMGTACQLDARMTSPGVAREFAREVQEWVRCFEHRFSRFIPESLISRINLQAGHGWVEIDSDAEALFALCDWFYWRSNRVFDPSSLPLLKLWDYHSNQATPPADKDITAALAFVGWSRIERDGLRIRLPESGMGLDMGGIGKEYAVDKVMEMAIARGIEDVQVNFGRDLRVHGEPPQGGPWLVGLEDPSNPGNFWGGVAVKDRSVTTSGNYRRFFMSGNRRYGHIIDPRNGYPVDNSCLSVSVISPSCTEAGILSTTTFILGPEEGLKELDRNPQVQGCLWTDQGRWETRGFNEYLVQK